MKRALVIGASGGIGQAVTSALIGQAVQVATLSRREDGLDVTDPTSVDRHLGGLEGSYDLIFIAVGILAVPGGAPEKSLNAVSANALADVFAVNAIGPALILRHAARLLPRRERGVVAVLSARVGSIGDNKIGGWHSYRASKAALNQIVRGAAIELARSHKQSIVTALHPGTVETEFTANYAARHATKSADRTATQLLEVIDRLTLQQTGGFFDYNGAPVPW